MQESFDAALNAQVTQEAGGRIRGIRYQDEYAGSGEDSPLAAAIEYVQQVAGVFEIAGEELVNLHVQSSHLDPADQGVQYRLAAESQSFDSVTFGFDQTYLNTPVWGAGISVTVKTGPNRIVQTVNTVQDGIDAVLPSAEVLDRLRATFQAAEGRLALRRAGDRPSSEDDDGRALVQQVLGVNSDLVRGRFWIYKYEASARLPAAHEEQVTLPLPGVDGRIVDGRYYLVAEITFRMPGEVLTWKALFEPETRSVLYLRTMASGLTGHVFNVDPPTRTADTSLNSASGNAILNAFRDTVTLMNLDPPVDGTQALRGRFGELREVAGDVVAAPTVPAGANFHFDTRTDDFAAVSAYFHVDRVFRTIDDLGFTGYFRNTVFPIAIDHRYFKGGTIDARCVGDGAGGIGLVGYGVMDTDLVNPLGRACDPRVHWHELCGHGILHEYVDRPNFAFAHSAGDSLAGIFFDPDSKLWGVDGTPLNKPGDLRFSYVPWHPTMNRRFDRDVAAGWAWGGSRDDKGYGSEEILATTLFRVYRSIGGDSADVARRRFASRMMMYLILRAVSTLTPATNPRSAREFAAALMAVDQLNWTSEGIFGGAYAKVIRWSFERQGEYQDPLVTGRVVAPGLPPDQDVYIDDGRAGEYGYQPIHWQTTTIWSRRSADGGSSHEQPLIGQTNFVYVKVKNRGTQTANDVVVRGYHAKPGAGLLWPNDFTPFDTPQLSVASVEEAVVGPFSWTPSVDGHGHDSLLMIASAPGDGSNVDSFTAGEVIEEWRLVPNDNNIGLRNVNLVPGSASGLLRAFEGVGFWVRDPDVMVAVHLPEFLATAGWELLVDVQPDAHVRLRLTAGGPFTPQAGDIRIEARADGNLVGGMTYRLDPDLTDLTG